MATGGGSAGAQVCPLCGAVVEGGDQLQLHYLTSCSGYDMGQWLSKRERGEERGESVRVLMFAQTLIS